MLGSISKHVGDIEIYTIDWSDWLATGDSIATSVWTLPSGLTNVTDSSTSTTTAIKISGGVAHASYTLTNTVTTSVSTETRVETFVLKVKP